MEVSLSLVPRLSSGLVARRSVFCVIGGVGHFYHVPHILKLKGGYLVPFIHDACTKSYLTTSPPLFIGVGGSWLL